MKRRELLAIGGIGITATAGCYQALSSDEDEESSENSSQENESADISKEQPNTTDDESSEPVEEEAQAQDKETDSETNETREQNTTDTLGGDPVDAVEIVEHEMIFEEAADPNYDNDELYIQATIRNASDRDLKNVRLDGTAYANDVPVGREYLEYSDLEAGGEREPEIQFYVDDPAAVERYQLKVTTAQWA